MTSEDIRRLLKPLAAVCSGECDGHRVKAFHGAMQGLSFDSVEAAIATYLMTAEDRWWPMPGTIRRMALQQSDGRHLSADEAWALVETASRTWTRHDPARAKAATAGIPSDVLEMFRSLGGFVTLQESDPTGASVMRSHFLKLWVERVQQAETERATPEVLRPRIAPATSKAITAAATAMRLPN